MGSTGRLPITSGECVVGFGVVGDPVGASVGPTVVGDDVGASVGPTVVGDSVGDSVGERVGAPVVGACNKGAQSEMPLFKNVTTRIVCSFRSVFFSATKRVEAEFRRDQVSAFRNFGDLRGVPSKEPPRAAS